MGWGPILLLLIFLLRCDMLGRYIFRLYPEKGMYFLGVLTIFFS